MPDSVRRLIAALLSVLGLVLCDCVAHAQSEAVDFRSERWTMVDAEIVTRYDRECLAGTAILPDAAFGDGVIEVDIAVDGSRSYPGLVFRMESEENYERVYIRPHRAGFYPDAVQYTPIINRIESWQLYNGPGYTAAAEVPAGEWVPLKLEVRGNQARLYVNDRPYPTLEIRDLKHGESFGSIGVLGPKNQSACFSSFRYRVDSDLSFGEPAPQTTARGTLLDWEVSRAFPALQVNRDAYPSFYAIFMAGWQPAAPEPSGLVNVAWYARRSGQDPDLVLARTVLQSEEGQDITLSFGYSDEVDLFLNGRKVFSGNSAYRFRDPSFLGVVGLFDAVNLALEPGRNEIFMMVTEAFGGWGFMAKADRELAPPVTDYSRTEKVWETPQEFLTAESVAYDSAREVLYVTNFDARFNQTPEFTGYISRVSMDGVIEDARWVTDLDAPTGITLRGDQIFVVERSSLTEIDANTGALTNRFPIPGAEFPNDIAIDDEGNIYVSDTSPSSHKDSRIYRFRSGEFEVWLDGDEIDRANGLHFHGGRLLVGNSGDGFLKSVDVATRRIEKIICLGAGVIDGIRVDSNGNYIVSQWAGHVYVVSPAGDLVEVLETESAQANSADFEYVPELDLILIPTFLDNRVAAYRLSGAGDR
jgi:sugar lactone lactonase YvrE